MTEPKPIAPAYAQSAIPFSAWLSDAFSQLIIERTGLTFKPLERSVLEQKIMTRVKALNYPFPEAYYQLLSESSAASQQEWLHLSEQLTNGESFFFRDRGQFSVLKQQILPELIERQSVEKVLRICSAGCATGEEAYSLAILVDALLRERAQDIEQWDVRIDGVDLNAAAIAQAKTGMYRPWSLRGLSDEQKQTYFTQIENCFHIQPRFKARVRFQPLNLVQDELIPDELISDGEREREGTQAFDLIVCRNVFIYFTKDAIAKVIHKFYQALRPQGYLLTGHAELYEQNLSPFIVKNLPGSLAFQRPDHEGFSVNASLLSEANAVLWKNLQQHSQAQPLPQYALKNSSVSSLGIDSAIDSGIDSAITKSPTMDSQNHYQQANTFFNNQAFEPALAAAKQALTEQPNSSKILCLIAQIYTALNRTDTAIDYCHQALTANSSLIEPHYLLAKLFIGKGNPTAAKRTLKKIIYLDPNAVVAYLELSQLYEQENNLAKSTLFRQSALKIFSQHLPPTQASSAHISPTHISSTPVSLTQASPTPPPTPDSLVQP
ncbi:MAG: CheR family methyltransferase [Cyanobacteria bacterium J06650_10]